MCYLLVAIRINRLNKRECLITKDNKSCRKHGLFHYFIGKTIIKKVKGFINIFVLYRCVMIFWKLFTIYSVPKCCPNSCNVPFASFVPIWFDLQYSVSHKRLCSVLYIYFWHETHFTLRILQIRGYQVNFYCTWMILRQVEIVLRLKLDYWWK